MLKRWNKPWVNLRKDMINCAFNIGDDDMLATDMKRGYWYFALERTRLEFWGPYNTRKGAKSAQTKYLKELAR